MFNRIVRSAMELSVLSGEFHFLILSFAYMCKSLSVTTRSIVWMISHPRHHVFMREILQKRVGKNHFSIVSDIFPISCRIDLLLSRKRFLYGFNGPLFFRNTICVRQQRRRWLLMLMQGSKSFPYVACFIPVTFMVFPPLHDYDKRSTEK